MRISDGSSTPSTLLATEDEATVQRSTPQGEASPATQSSTSPPPPTPQQRVDQAVARYDAAVKSKDPGAIAQARADVYASVAAEVGPQVDVANAHIPSQFQSTASTNQQIASYGNSILRRHEDDPTAQSVLHDALADYQVQRQADSLVPSFYGSNITPKEKLDTLKTLLQGAPADVAARAMRNPSVQQMLKDSVSWIAQPYNNRSNGVSPAENQQAALESSQRLAAITSDLPAAYAQQIVQQSMPTIQKIAGVDANYSGSGAFSNLSNVVARLGSDPQAQALTQQIAHAYHGQLNTWEGRFDDPRGGIIRFAVGNGADPKLSLALASQLQATGQSAQAGAVVRSVESGVEQLQDRVGQDMQAYQNQTKDLSWAVASSQGKLDQAQLQTAINSYISQQPREWRDQFQSTQSQLVADTQKLNSALGELQSVSGGPLGKAAPDAFAALKQNVGANQTTQQAIEFTATRDPSLFAGSNGSAAVDFWADAGGRSKNLMDSLATGYIADNVLPAIKGLNTGDPKSVAQVEHTLDEFQGKASKLLGIPPEEVKAGVGKLKQIIHTLQTTTSMSETVTAIHQFDATNKELAELKDMQFTSGPAAAAFRTVAFALTGAAALNQNKNTLSDPSIQNLIGSFGQSVGAVQDGTAFAAKLGLISQDSTAGQWGRAASVAGEATAKFVGLLDSAYFVAGGIHAYDQGDIPSTVLNGIGVGGAGLATFGEMLGAGSWAGPVGWGITILAAGGLALVQEREDVNRHTALEQKFLQGAGLSANVSKALSSDAAQEATMVQQQLKPSPAELQRLAATHPEVFNMAPGYTQAVISFASANGIRGQTLAGFLDAAQKDNPDYIQRFFMLSQAAAQPGHPLTQKAVQFDMIAQGFPNAARYVQQHSPALVGPAADARRRADTDYESAMSGLEPWVGIANLLKANHNPAYQAEIVNIMKDNGTLGHWVSSIGGAYAYNGWPQAAQSGIRAAESEGVLTQPQAREYLRQLG